MCSSMEAIPRYLSPGPLLCLDVSPCHLSPGSLLLPGWDPMSNLTWSTAPAWMRVPVICQQDLYFHLYFTKSVSPCHFSPRPQLLPGWESLPSLTLTVLLPGCQSISFLTWTTASSWMGVYVISHLDHSSHLDGFLSSLTW